LKLPYHRIDLITRHKIFARDLSPPISSASLASRSRASRFWFSKVCCCYRCIAGAAWPVTRSTMKGSSLSR